MTDAFLNLSGSDCPRLEHRLSGVRFDIGRDKVTDPLAKYWPDTEPNVTFRRYLAYRSIFELGNLIG